MRNRGNLVSNSVVEQIENSTRNILTKISDKPIFKSPYNLNIQFFSHLFNFLQIISSGALKTFPIVHRFSNERIWNTIIKKYGCIIEISSSSSLSSSSFLDASSDLHKRVCQAIRPLVRQSVLHVFS